MLDVSSVSDVRATVGVSGDVNDAKASGGGVSGMSSGVSDVSAPGGDVSGVSRDVSDVQASSGGGVSGVSLIELMVDRVASIVHAFKGDLSGDLAWRSVTTHGDVGVTDAAASLPPMPSIPSRGLGGGLGAAVVVVECRMHPEAARQFLQVLRLDHVVRRLAGGGAVRAVVHGLGYEVWPITARAVEAGRHAAAAPMQLWLSTTLREVWRAAAPVFDVDTLTQDCNSVSVRCVTPMLQAVTDRLRHISSRVRDRRFCLLDTEQFVFDAVVLRSVAASASAAASAASAAAANGGPAASASAAMAMAERLAHVSHVSGARALRTRDALREACCMVANAGWRMDDAMCGRDGWVVAWWRDLVRVPGERRLPHTSLEHARGRGGGGGIGGIGCIDGRIGGGTDVLGVSMVSSAARSPTVKLLPPYAHSTCAICQERFHEDDLVVNLGCNHNFHTSHVTHASTSRCRGLGDWLQQGHDTCPCCRAHM